MGLGSECTTCSCKITPAWLWLPAAKMTRNQYESDVDVDEVKLGPVSLGRCLSERWRKGWEANMQEVRLGRDGGYEGLGVFCCMGFRARRVLSGLTSDSNRPGQAGPAQAWPGLAYGVSQRAWEGLYIQRSPSP